MPLWRLEPSAVKVARWVLRETALGNKCRPPDDNVALIYDSPVTGNKSQYTYSQLRYQVSKVAGMLASQGVEKGDCVII